MSTLEESIAEILRESPDTRLFDSQLLAELYRVLERIAQSPPVLQEVSRSVRAMANTNDPRSVERGLQMLGSMIRRQQDQGASEARNAASWSGSR